MKNPIKVRKKIANLQESSGKWTGVPGLVQIQREEPGYDDGSGVYPHMRVGRGGAWHKGGGDHNVEFRGGGPWTLKFPVMGFRFVRTKK